MERRLSFRVEGEAIPSPRPRICTKNGKSWAYYSDPKYTKFMKAVKSACPEKHHFDEAQVKIYFMTNKKGDIDNLSKGVLDALTGVLWDNDKVVWDLHVLRLDIGKKDVPWLDIEVLGNEPNHEQIKL